MMMKILGVLGAILPIIGAIFYFGQLDNRIEVLETAEDQALQLTISQLQSELGRFREIHAQLLDHAHEQDIRWASWDARWGHLISATAVTNLGPSIPSALNAPANPLAPAFMNPLASVLSPGSLAP